MIKWTILIVLVQNLCGCYTEMAFANPGPAPCAGVPGELGRHSVPWLHWKLLFTGSVLIATSGGLFLQTPSRMAQGILASWSSLQRLLLGFCQEIFIGNDSRKKWWEKETSNGENHQCAQQSDELKTSWHFLFVSFRTPAARDLPSARISGRSQWHKKFLWER